MVGLFVKKYRPKDSTLRAACRSLALGGQIDGHGYTCALDESIDKGAGVAVAVYMAAKKK